MEYKEVKRVLEGYCAVVLIEKGLDIRLERDKKVNELQYWFRDKKKSARMCSFEMGDVRNEVVMRFEPHDDLLFYAYRIKELGANFYFNGDVLRCFIRSIGELQSLLDVAQEMNFFNEMYWGNRANNS